VLKSVASSVAGIALAGALVASPALADGGCPIYGDCGFKDEVLYAPPPIVWSGFYIGLHAGGGWGNSDWEALEDLAPPIVVTGDRLGHDIDGGLIGGHIGFNLQTGRLVWGIEGTLSGTNISDDRVTDFGFPINPVRLEAEIDTLWSVTGRLGYDWGRLLTYVKAGYAGADVELSAKSLGFAVSDSQIHHGWTVGAGLEYLASENLVLGVEYNFYDFGSEDYGRRLPGFDTDHLVENDLDLHTVTARISYKFGRRAPLIAEPLPPLK